MKTGLLSVIVPFRNGGRNLGEALGDAREMLNRHAPQHELIIVDDASHDESAALIDDLSASHQNVFVLHHRHPLGYGAALRDGWKVARGERVLAVDLASLPQLADLDRVLALGERYAVILAARPPARRLPPWCAKLASARDPLWRFALCDVNLGKHIVDGRLPHLALFEQVQQRGLAVAEVDLPERLSLLTSYQRPRFVDLLRYAEAQGTLPRPRLFALAIATLFGFWLWRRRNYSHS